MGAFSKCVLLLLSFHINCRVQSSYQIVKSCHKSTAHSEQVIWNFTIFGLENHFQNSSTIFIQTREHQKYTHEWADLTKCNRSATDNRTSVQCEINEQNWFMYALRVVKRNSVFQNISHNNTERNTSGNSMILFEEHGHYQSGLLCYPFHDVVNLSYSALTTKSFKISWNFHPWDVELIEFLHVRVLKEESLANGSSSFLLFSEYPFLEPELWTSVNVRGLTSCTKYKVVVIYQYISYHDQVTRRKSIFVHTKCESSSKSHRRLIVAFTLLAYMLIAGAGIGAFCVIYRRKTGARRRTRTLSNSDIIDDCVLTAELCALRVSRPNP